MRTWNTSSADARRTVKYYDRVSSDMFTHCFYSPTIKKRAVQIRLKAVHDETENPEQYIPTTVYYCNNLRAAFAWPYCMQSIHVTEGVQIFCAACTKVLVRLLCKRRRRTRRVLGPSCSIEASAGAFKTKYIAADEFTQALIQNGSPDETEPCSLVVMLCRCAGRRGT